MLSEKNLKSTVSHYLSGLFIYGAGMLLYFSSSYYVYFLNTSTKEILIFLFLFYTFTSPVYFLLKTNKDIVQHKPYIFIGAVRKSLSGFLHYVHVFVQDPSHKIQPLAREEKTVILFMLVKLFYIPLMINFFTGNWGSVVMSVYEMGNAELTLNWLSSSGYVIMLNSIFLIDTLWFAFGYLVESGYLDNKVKSVEPTVLGWAVALACYPPFNDLLGNYVPWNVNEYVIFSSNVQTFVARACILLTMLIYGWATISLGTKCSNLTNRGIVQRGAYRFVRHPAYVAKNIAWWIMILPVLSPAMVVGGIFWSSIYFLRAITEERHLIQDPEYQEYCKRVKYRFIPRVY